MSEDETQHQAQTSALDGPMKKVTIEIEMDDLRSRSSSSMSSKTSRTSNTSNMSIRNLLKKKKRSKPAELDYPFHTFEPEDSAATLATSTASGLTDSEVHSRLAKYGPNQLKVKGAKNPFILFLGHLFNSLSIILFIAMGASFGTQEWIEGGVIAAVIVINAVIGFFQEFRSERTMEALKKMTSPNATVIRNSVQIDVPARTVVPGDVVCLEEGDVVPADLRLFEVSNLEIDEALLTGESLPVEKNIDTIPDEDRDLADRINLAFSSCIVTKGRGKGLAIATGMDTELGFIASKLAARDNKKTPLQKRLDLIAWILFFVALILAVVVFAANKFKIDSEVVLYAIGLGVGVIPEGLVAVVTMTMALGVRRMSKQKALVRKLNALEALGAVTDICSDKTGTLTQAKMVVTEAWICPNKTLSITGEGLVPEGQFINVEDKQEVTQYDEALTNLLLTGALCNISSLEHVDGKWVSTGDPTEVAFQVLARKAKMYKQGLVNSGYKFIAEEPFDSVLKRMSVIYSHEGTTYVFSKGALESLVKTCTHYQNGSTVEPITQEFITSVTAVNHGMASRALRSLGVAYKKDFTYVDDESTRDDVESQMVFVGIVGILDPPRPESQGAVQVCKQAGIKVRMLTGDHPITAKEISKQLDIVSEHPGEGQVMSASVFNKKTEKELDFMPELPLVVARCSPDSKVQMVEALHRRKRIVAMTGDGVNDAPALKKADIGIAMGLAGSDVAKNTADIILTDDNFSTIVGAVKEGRRIYANVLKFIVHLMTVNVSEIIALVIGLAFIDADGRSVYAMSPLQILWLNISTSTPASLGLGVENADDSIMNEPPRSEQKGFARIELVVDILYYGFWIGVLILVDFVIVVYGIGEGDLGTRCNHRHNDTCDPVFRARSTTFASGTLMFLLHAYNCKHLRKSVFQMKWFDNAILLWSVIVGFLVIIPFFYIPYVNYELFKHAPITYEWAIVFGTGALFMILAEIYKLVKRILLRHYYHKKGLTAYT